MFRVIYVDGSSLSGKDCDWLDIPRDKKIEALEVAFTGGDKPVALRGMDRYYYYKESVLLIGSPGNSQMSLAAIAGGFNDGDAFATQIRCTPTFTGIDRVQVSSIPQMVIR